MAKLVKDFSTEERQHILQQLTEEGLDLEEVASLNGTTWQVIRAIRRIELGEAGRRKTTPEERERIWKRVGEVGFAQAAAENHLSENTILNWRWRYKMDEPDHAEAEKKPAYNKVYTPEEKADILAFARKAGVADAAKRFNVSTTSIRNWTRQEQPIQGELPFQSQEVEHHSDQSQATAQVQEPVIHHAEEIVLHDEVAMEPRKEAVQGDSTIEALLPADSKVRALVARVQELNIEVAILKERNAVLTQKIEALKASVTNLL